ncbi:sugar transferase [Hyphomicrobium sp. CS1GBMeth3]|uniref:sugar transferase n=1 Tax=Hyphomicrobium sp. CS1GBMeth3 TaxID=1892845 RepID=UPI000931756A|nr:sugar transferase [Hyphomicrobium sp. CS1GBMeth3]
MRPVGGLGKRVADIAIAGVVGIAAMPILLLVGLAIKLSMGGPILYRHRRIGFGGRPFDCLKFRTMVVNGDEVLARYLANNPAAAEEWRRDRKLVHDPRVTRLGALLRKSSLDELPQLLNILRGEMSCVGPRPVVADELVRYGIHAEAYLRARPGMTGSWQVSGRSTIDYGDRVALDSAYVRKWSFASDILILVRTVPALLKVDQAA